MAKPFTAETVAADLAGADDPASCVQSFLERTATVWSVLQRLAQGKVALLMADSEEDSDQVPVGCEALIEEIASVELGAEDFLAEEPELEDDSQAVLFRKRYAQLEQRSLQGAADWEQLRLAGSALVALNAVCLELGAVSRLIGQILKFLTDPDVELAGSGSDADSDESTDSLVQFIDPEKLLRLEGGEEPDDEGSFDDGRDDRW